MYIYFSWDIYFMAAPTTLFCFYFKTTEKMSWKAKKWIRQNLTHDNNSGRVEFKYSLEPVCYHVLSEVWSNIDQIFDHQILLSKFTNMVSDSQISDQLLIVHDKAQWQFVENSSKNMSWFRIKIWLEVSLHPVWKGTCVCIQ